MINSIQIKGFKCFNENNFDLKPLTILSGRNASGKTSFLQVFALLHQTICERGNFEQLVLNGPIVKLGRADDILHKTKAKDTIFLSVKTTQGLWSREYHAPDRDKFTLKNKSMPHGTGQDKEIMPIFHSLTYLSADRFGPNEFHSIDDSTLYPDVGSRGEHAISRLLSNNNYNVPELLCVPNTAPPLNKQIEAHMQKIFPGFRLDTKPILGTNNATLSFATNDAVGFVRPQNIGYGLSHSLPIYVACLSAKKNDVILVENPEAHLHPNAQSKIGEFLATVASSGIQIIVETHSDHVLNGIRKSIKSDTHPIKSTNTQIFFFGNLTEDALPNIKTPSISDNGQLSEWPKDFFDQYENDLAELVNW
jgi:predicted ATPase